MTKKKPTPSVIRSAKTLLEKNGYTVRKLRPHPQIGDIVRFRDTTTPMDVLIVFHQTDDATPEDVYDFGGVQVGRGTYQQLYTEPLWVDREEWQKDDGAYKIVGRIDLTSITFNH
jgi:mRNA-degrading endonuclease YafQ of YafQ-DinJ toxin-antitoxin module